jgi:hypothetical protein
MVQAGAASFDGHCPPVREQVQASFHVARANLICGMQSTCGGVVHALDQGTVLVACVYNHAFPRVSCFLMNFFKIIPPHAHAPAAAVGSPPPAAAPSQPANVASVSPLATAVTGGSSADDLTLANTCCAGSLFPRAYSLYFALAVSVIDQALQRPEHGIFFRRSVSTPICFFAGFVALGLYSPNIAALLTCFCLSSVLLDGPLSVENPS